MKRESFEALDSFFGRCLGPEHRKAVPRKLLKNFSWDVEMKIRQAQENPMPASPWAGRGRFFSPAWAPICAALILLAVVVPHFRPINASELSIEIAAMREMGVWTEEDESAVAGAETGLGDLEIFQTL